MNRRDQKQRVEFQVWLSAAVLAAASGMAVGQAPPPPPVGDLLGGPDVQDRGTPGGGPAMGFDGEMERLEIPLEESVVESMELDEATRARVQEVLTKRAAALDELVRGNRKELLQMLEDFRSQRGQDGPRRLPDGLVDMLSPFVAEQGPLSEQIVSALSDEQSVEFRTKLRQQAAALIESRQRQRGAQDGAGRRRGPGGRGGAGGPGGAGEGPRLFEGEPGVDAPPPEGGGRPGRGGPGGGPGGLAERLGTPPAGEGARLPPQFQTQLSLAFGSLQQELRRSIERTVRQPAEDMQAALAAIGLTPEQEGQLQGLMGKLREVRQAMQGEGGQPGGQPGAGGAGRLAGLDPELFTQMRTFMESLTDEQRSAVRELMGGRRGEGRRGGGREGRRGGRPGGAGGGQGGGQAPAPRP